MAFLGESELGDDFAPFAAFRRDLGFIPRLFRAQTLLPRALEAQARIAAAVLVAEHELSPAQKQLILLTVASTQRDPYCLAFHAAALRRLGISEAQLDELLRQPQRGSLSEADLALRAFAAALARNAPGFGSDDIESLRRHRFDDGAILEAIQVTALGRFLCTLSFGLAPEPDFDPPALPPAAAASPGPAHSHAAMGPYLRAVYHNPQTFAPFAFFQQNFGFVPNIFRAQTLRPEAVEAEAGAVADILLPNDVLTRVQKECILLAISAATFNSYCVAVHCELLRGLGMPLEESDQIAVDHHFAPLSPADKALLDFALTLGLQPASFGLPDIDRLRAHGFSEVQVLEAVVMTALTNFLNTAQVGLGTVADFDPPFLFQSKKMHPAPAAERPMDGSAPSAPEIKDPDAELVVRAQGGGLDAFEDLIRRHSRHVYRILLAILGNQEEAQDAMQDAFVSAFRHLKGFRARSKFSTWLVSIARNTAFQRLRERKNLESLDGTVGEPEEAFRPRQVSAWQDNPEQIYSQQERRRLVEQSILRLPAKYRAVLLLRDLEQLSTEEVALALDLSVPALKARLLRGRLMLRELLAPHFAQGAGRAQG